MVKPHGTKYNENDDTESVPAKNKSRTGKTKRQSSGFTVMKFFLILVKMLWKLMTVLWKGYAFAAQTYPQTTVSIFVVLVLVLSCGFYTFASPPESPGKVLFPHSAPVTYDFWQDCENGLYKCTKPTKQFVDCEFKIVSTDLTSVRLTRETGEIMIPDRHCGFIQVSVESKDAKNVMLMTVTHKVPDCIANGPAALQPDEWSKTSLMVTSFTSGAAGAALSGAALWAFFASG